MAHFKEERKKSPVFKIIYFIAFAVAAIFGLLSNSFFAYKAFNSLWAQICYALLISALFITALIEDALSATTRKDIIIAVIVFCSGLAAFLLMYILGGVLVLIALITSFFISVLVCCNYMQQLKNNPELKPNLKQFVCALGLCLFCMVSLTSIEFESWIFIAWALIPAAVLTAAALGVSYFMLRKVWNDIYTTKRSQIWNKVALAFLVFMFAVIYSATAAGIANCVFESVCTPAQYTVLNKKINSGSRTPTEFLITVNIGGKDKQIPVSVEDYHSLEIGDYITVDRYTGALNIPYYVYRGTAK